jgi:hypothetical protein
LRTFLARTIDARRSIKLGLSSLEPTTELLTQIDPKTFQMPQEENLQEDTSACHPSYSAVLIEGLRNLTLSPILTVLPLSLKGHSKSRTERNSYNSQDIVISIMEKQFNRRFFSHST